MSTSASLQSDLPPLKIETRRTNRFDHAVVVFFVLVVLGLGEAAASNAPLSFDGALYFFKVLDTHEFFAVHGRLISFPLETPVLTAAHFSQNLAALRFIFCASYAAIPAFSLLLCWLICRPRRAWMFIWPAMSICLAGLPGQFVFVSESIMSVTLLWPALLCVLVDAPTTYLPLVAVATIAATVSHLAAIGPLALIVVLAGISVVTRPRTKKASLMFALAFGILLIVRVLMPLDNYETKGIAIQGFIDAFRDSLYGWPLVALVFTGVAALGCFRSSKSTARVQILVPLALAGLALVLWSVHPAIWESCLFYRSWVMPITLPFMGAAAVEELWWSGRENVDQREVRFYALPLIGVIFFAVLSVQSFEWAHLSRVLASNLINSDRGCIATYEIPWIEGTPLGNWAISLYAVDLQSRKPKTVLVPSGLECRYFDLTGTVTFVDKRDFSYIRQPDQGWFDFRDAQLRTKRQLK